MHPSARLVALVCATLVVGALPLAGLPLVAAAPGSGFGADTYEDQAGDVVHLDLSVPSGSTAVLVVAGPAYRAEATVVDLNGDGLVVVRLNTFTAGWQATERVAYDAAGTDRVAHVVRESPTRAAPLPTGPYALELRGPVEDRASLDLTAATFDAAVPSVVPRDARPANASDLGSLAASNGTVADGDWAVVTFHAGGLSGIARVGAAPVENLVYATESAPNAESAHVVRHRLGTDGAPSTVTLDYAAGDGGVPSDLADVSRTTLSVGYDRDGDSTVDVDLTPAVSRVTLPSTGQVVVSLTEAPPAIAGDVLVVRLPVTNPDRSGADTVALTVDDERTEGTVEYGLAGSGALGNGLDLRLAPVGPDGGVGTAQPVSPAVHEVFVDAGRDTLSVVFDTSRLDHDTYAATLALTPANPRVSTPRTLTTTFTVVERDVALTRPASSFTVDAATVPVAVTTTLAPGTELTVHVSSTSTPNLLQVYVLTVGPDRTASVDVTLSDRLRGTDVRFVVRENGEVVAGPHVGRPG
jgi:hypothetical protein